MAAPGPATSSDLAKLTGRLQALRAKTVANGCTEEEALSAAAKVAELLDRHDLTLSDLEMRAEPCIQVAVTAHKKQRQAMAACVGAIADFCDCKVWREKDAGGVIRHVFFGLPASAEMARTLHDIIDAAMQAAWADYRAGQRFIRHGQDEKSAFLVGMAVSVADKLHALKARREDATRGATGRDLVVVRHAIVEEAFAKLDLTFRQGGGSGKAYDPGAFEAGQAAGRGVAVPAVRPVRDGR